MCWCCGLTLQELVGGILLVLDIPCLKIPASALLEIRSRKLPALADIIGYLSHLQHNYQAHKNSGGSGTDTETQNRYE